MSSKSPYLPWRFAVYWLTALFLVLSLDSPQIAVAQSKTEIVPAVRVLMYHRFGEDRYPSTNIRMEQFLSHLDQIREGGYTVVSLSDAVDALMNGGSLPPKAIAITVDDAYLSFGRKAWPILRDRGIPATLFVATDPVDGEVGGYLNWDQIRAMQEEGLSIGHHGAGHIHMPLAGVDKARADVRRASARFKAELGDVPTLFAYPYGEYDPHIMAMVEAEGLTAAFAQYSAPMSRHMPKFALPRFALNENFGSLDRFNLVARTQAFPVSDILPRSPVITDRNPPYFGFTIGPDITDIRNLACYPSHLGKAATIESPTPGRVEVRFDKPFPRGRSRINCTMPAPGGGFYWLGAFFLVPGAEE